MLLGFHYCLGLAVMQEIRGADMNYIDIILLEHIGKYIGSWNAQLLRFFICKGLVYFYQGDYFYIRDSSECF